MRRFSLTCALLLATVPFIGSAQSASEAGPYKVIKTAKVGGDGGFDTRLVQFGERGELATRRGVDGAQHQRTPTAEG